MEDAKEENGRQPGATGTSAAQGLEVNRSLAQLNSKELNNATHTHTQTVLRPISPTDWTVTDYLAFKDGTTKEKERMRPHSFVTVPYSRECS
jgi:hypothetical protein